MPRYTSHDVAAVHDAEQAFLKVSLTKRSGPLTWTVTVPWRVR
ncbi:hypothetical protein BJ973_005647 [Actinoplanes tereljensis]